MPITRESIKKYLQDERYTKIVFSPKGHEELWSNLPSNYPDFKVQPGEELPHDNFITITGYTPSPIPNLAGRRATFLKEVKEGENDFLTDLFKWVQQEKVKTIEVDEQWNIIIHKKTQEDYQRDEAVKNWRVNKVVDSYAKTCLYCNKKFEFVYTPGDNVNAEKRVRFQHWESCSSCPEEVRTLAKKKIGELPPSQVDETTEYNRLTDLIRKSKDLEELEENWETVKSNPLYDAEKITFSKYGDYINNKKHFDQLYDAYKNSRGLKSKNNNPNDNSRERERERDFSITNSDCWIRSHC